MVNFRQHWYFDWLALFQSMPFATARKPPGGAAQGSADGSSDGQSDRRGPVIERPLPAMSQMPSVGRMGVRGGGSSGAQRRKRGAAVAVGSVQTGRPGAAGGSSCTSCGQENLGPGVQDEDG